MRLINIHSLRLEEFFGRNIPPYLILSHTWGNEEISFQEYTWLQAYAEKLAAGVIEEKPPKQRERLKAKDESLCRRSGYQKIIHFVQLVLHLELEKFNPNLRMLHYIWIDTCCINKESSAELSEAINSMYQWYKGAEVCIAFLADVEDTKDTSDSDFGKSRWFSRGWTLQELLAPRWVLFYNNRWEYITQKGLASQAIKKVTGIDGRHLTPLWGYDRKGSVAEKMSWAAKRQTTRLEDEAYCLMGIFGINMPLLYGEGKKAFVRLQEEIIKRDGDQTIFAWGYNRRLEIPPKIFGMLAQSPKDFEHCGEINLINWPTEIFQRNDTPYHMTNLGLQISVALFRPIQKSNIIFAILPCLNNGQVLGFPILGNVPEDIQDGHIVNRSFGHPIALFHYLSPWPSNVIRRTVIIGVRHDPYKLSVGSNQIHLDPGPRIEILETWPKCAVELFYKPLIRCASSWQGERYTTFFRVRVESTDRPVEFVVIVIPKSEKTSPIQVRVFEWEIFRGTQTCNDELCFSLAGLFIASPEMLDPAVWPNDESKHIPTTIKEWSRGQVVSLGWGT